jgi:group I intron endonuclease
MIVYLITNLTNDKVYVGQHQGDDLLSRWKDHCAYARSGGRFILSNAIRKYGEDGFSVSLLATANSRKELDSLERIWITLLHSYDSSYGYNMTRGGDGWHGICEESMEKLKAKRREFMKGNTNVKGKNWKAPTISARNLRSIWVNNGIESRFIVDTKASTLLDNGWKLGRLEASWARNTSTHWWIYKNGCRKRVKEEELNHYLTEGWQRGKGSLTAKEATPTIPDEVREMRSNIMKGNKNALGKHWTVTRSSS